MNRMKLSDDQELPGDQEKADTQENEGGAYFSVPTKQSHVKKFTTGCALLDCVLGGGWPEGKLTNIVGDSGSAKSLLAIESSANFLKKYPNGEVYYIETEQAFDPDYAESLGIDTNSLNLVDNIYTVEDMFRDLYAKLEQTQKEEKNILYIVDSLDALSDEAEQDRDIGEGSYGANKPKKLSELFRKLHAKLGQANITILIVSQVRDNIGVAFGEKHTRSGGKALQFYSSLSLWLAYTGKIEKTKNKVKNTIGVNIRAKTKKNRLGPPFRTCDLQVIFNFGVDDLSTNINWLSSVDRLKDSGIEVTKEGLGKKLSSIKQEDFEELCEKIDDHTRKVWADIEQEFKPKLKKY